MIRFSLLAALLAAAPSMAVAQVGPNPTVNGSLDPTVGSSTDAATAPEDVKVGTEPTVDSAADKPRDADPTVPAASAEKRVDGSAAMNKGAAAPAKTEKKPR